MSIHEFKIGWLEAQHIQPGDAVIIPGSPNDFLVIVSVQHEFINKNLVTITFTFLTNTGRIFDFVYNNHNLDNLENQEPNILKPIRFSRLQIALYSCDPRISMLEKYRHHNMFDELCENLLLPKQE